MARWCMARKMGRREAGLRALAYPAVHRCQPGLLFAGQALGSIVMRQFHEARGSDQASPPLKIVVSAKALPIPYVFVVPARVGAEQHTTGLERSMQRAQHARQFLRRNMEQRRVGKHAVKALDRQIEVEKILVPYLAA